MSGNPDNSIKRINFLRETVDYETGQVLTQEREGVIDREPDYIKLYISGILLYADCPAWQNKVLHALLKRINFQNEISLPAGYKKEIMRELNISSSSLSNAISRFVKAKLLIRKDIGVYLANPHLFGRGEWKNIRKLRLTVDFSPEKISMNGEVEREEGEQIPDNTITLSSTAINPAKLIAFLNNPANHTDAIAMSSIGILLGFSFSCFNQLFFL